MPEHQQTQQSKKPDTTFQKQATPVSQTSASNPYSIIQRAKINPKSLTHADIMQLQRTIGNQAVGRLLSGIGGSSTAQQATVQRQEIPEEEEPLQGKMIQTIQRQEIPEEEEPLQGKMAEIVQRQEMPEEEEPLQGKMIETIQRQEIPEEEELLQGKFENKPEIACPSCFAAPIVQRQEIPEEEEPIQGKMIEPVQRQEIPEEEEPLQGKMIGPIQRQEIPEEEEPLQGKFESIQRQEIPKKEPPQAKTENNTGMPDNLKAGVESLSGMDMNDVRVHYNSDKPANVGALAYTQGTDIHVAPGQEKHLPHEAWHVVQQKQDLVKPTIQLKDGVPVNDDEGLEHEADVMGSKVLSKAAQFQGAPEEQGLLQGKFALEQGNGKAREELSTKMKCPTTPTQSDSAYVSYRLRLNNIQEIITAHPQSYIPFPSTKPIQGVFKLVLNTNEGLTVPKLIDIANEKILPWLHDAAYEGAPYSEKAIQLLTNFKSGLRYYYDQNANPTEPIQTLQLTFSLLINSSIIQLNTAIDQAAKKETSDSQEPDSSSLAQQHRDREVAPYLALIDHLAGEGGGAKALTGGHLLSEMKKKYPGLKISGAPSISTPWEGWWSDGVATPKWSSFFPANWSKTDLVREIRLSNPSGDKRELPSGILVTKTGDTFYPWVNQTLMDAPKITSMQDPS